MLLKWQIDELRKFLQLTRSKKTEGDFVYEIRFRSEMKEAELHEPHEFLIRMIEQIGKYVADQGRACNVIVNSKSRDSWKGKQMKGVINDG